MPRSNLARHLGCEYRARCHGLSVSGYPWYAQCGVATAAGRAAPAMSGGVHHAPSYRGSAHRRQLRLAMSLAWSRGDTRKLHEGNYSEILILCAVQKYHYFVFFILTEIWGIRSTKTNSTCNMIEVLTLSRYYFSHDAKMQNTK